MKLEDSIALWHKINAFSPYNYSNGRISNIIGVTKKLVAKYRKFKTVEEVEAFYLVTHFKASPQRDLLAQHENFFLEQLRHEAKFSNSQIMDHFKEEFPDAPEISTSTLRRYLVFLRSRDGIIRKRKTRRVYQMRDPLGAGKTAQVDFGEDYMFDRFGERIPVYFLHIVLDYSAFKFVYFIGEKFDSEHAVYALHRAFEYFGGYPESLIFDQDRVWLVNENQGDYILTKLLADFVRDVPFKPVFCHAYDPESKGRVERYIRFIKDNFLNGREFKSYEQLNREAEAWLRRTGNGQKHNFLKVSPSYLFYNEEAAKLTRYTFHMEDPDWKPKPYSVNKDHTINYKGCRYDVPPGLYLGSGTKVLLDDRTNPDRLRILNINQNLLVEYAKSEEKGVHFKLPEEMVKKEGMGKYEKMLRTKLNQWREEEPLSKLLQAIRNEKEERYVKGIFKELHLLVEPLDITDSRRLVKYCADTGKTSSQTFKEAMGTLHIQKKTSNEKGQITLGTYDLTGYEPESPRFNNYNFSDDNDD